MRLLSRTLLAFSGVLLASAMASAAPISITGNSLGALATAVGELTLSGNLLTLQITNTSPYDARITGFGFDLVRGDFNANGPPSSGLNSFSGGTVAGFTFSDGNLGNVPQFNSAVLDFGWITKNSFTAGFPNKGLAPGSSLTFAVASDFFLGLNVSDFGDSLFARFQRVGVNGGLSDVGPSTIINIPEPASLLLLGTGLAAMVARRRKSVNC